MMKASMWAAFSGLALSATAFAAGAGGADGARMEVEGGANLPLFSSDAEATITGDVATVRVTQVFGNSQDRPLHARYVFPLPHDAAVHAVTMIAGDEVVRAKIARIEEAKKTFELAKEEGKTASLLQEHRANVFTQDLANIPPGEEVRVTIEYAQTVPREDGRYKFHLPMAVGARYANGASGVAVAALDQALPESVLAAPEPGTPRVTKDGAARAQRHVAGEAGTRRVSVRIDLIAGLPVEALASPSHAIEVDHLGVDRRRVVLAQGRVVDDRDFVLEYRLAGKRIGAGLVAHRDERGTFFSLLIEPPHVVEEEEVVPRELVFVLDASCSMEGEPLRASKRLVTKMLELARPTDTIRVIHFGSDAKTFAAKELPATPDVLGRARRYVDQITGMGGTEIELGIRAALEPRIDDGRLRLVVFLTDGFIGDEASVMATIHQYRGGARIFSFGVGEGTNRWLLEEMAVAGRGVARIVALDESADAIVDDFAGRLRSPFLTGLSIDWGDLDIEDVTPDPLPDLYAGAPVRVLGRIAKDPPNAPPKHPDLRTSPRAPAIIGTMRGKAVRIPLAFDRGALARTVKQEDDTLAGQAIPILWARAQVADRLRALTQPAAMRGKHDTIDADLVEAITKLGLDFGITTRWTAFVAVSERKAATGKGPIAAEVPRPLVAGTFGAASGVGAGSGTASMFGSAPEPAEWACVLVLVGISAVVLRRRGVC